MLNIKSAFVSVLFCGLAATAFAQAPAPVNDAAGKVEAPAMVKKANPAGKKVVAKKHTTQKAHKAKSTVAKKKHKSKTAMAKKPHAAKAHIA
ncbi:MAG: hypothetical protein H6930_11125 [Rhodoferax sp.]|jgi:hypothetical protein|nr:hypothetical protein [Rhodoferax sp.]